MAGLCVACIQGFTWECRYHGNCGSAAGVNSGGSANPATNSVAFNSSADEVAELAEEDSFGEGEEFEPTVRTQDDANLKDQQSTGRKRAAKLFPLANGAPCEWRGKKNCGGGSKPIVGCFDGTQQARHHGPDKNTLNNEKGNVHRICHTCHNRWHTENDEGYVWGSKYPDHNPVAADQDDQLKNEVAWLSRTAKEVKD